MLRRLLLPIFLAGMPLGIVGCAQDERGRQPDRQNAKAPMLDDQHVNRLQKAFNLPASVNTQDALKSWLASRWDHFVEEGPLAHKPIRRVFLEVPWPGRPQKLYAGLFPDSIARNLLEFEVFVFYTSSIQQDLFATGEADLAFFVPDEKQIGINRLQTHLGTSEFLDDHKTIVARLRELRFLPTVDWFAQVKYKSAIVSVGESDIEIVTHTSEGFLTIFAVAG